jgi:hypothetical protein
MLNKYRKKLEQYNNFPTDELEEELISFICKSQLEIINYWKVEKPSTNDKYQDLRDFLDKIRKDLKLVKRTTHQHPPENIRDILKEQREKAEKEANKIEELITQEV